MTAASAPRRHPPAAHLTPGVVLVFYKNALVIGWLLYISLGLSDFASGCTGPEPRDKQGRGQQGWAAGPPVCALGTQLQPPGQPQLQGAELGSVAAAGQGRKRSGQCTKPIPHQPPAWLGIGASRWQLTATEHGGQDPWMSCCTPAVSAPGVLGQPHPAPLTAPMRCRVQPLPIPQDTWLWPHFEPGKPHVSATLLDTPRGPSFKRSQRRRAVTVTTVTSCLCTPCVAGFHPRVAPALPCCARTRQCTRGLFW